MQLSPPRCDLRVAPRVNTNVGERHFLWLHLFFEIICSLSVTSVETTTPVAAAAISVPVATPALQQ